MAKSVLRIQYEYPFEVIGIVSTAREYTLCHHLNRAMKMNFSRAEDLQIVINKQGDDTHFCLFRQDEDGESYLLIGNKGSNTWFFPEIKHVDYLFVVRDPGNFFSQDDLLRELRAISVISGAYPIGFEKLKSRENLLFLV